MLQLSYQKAKKVTLNFLFKSRVAVKSGKFALYVARDCRPRHGQKHNNYKNCRRMMLMFLISNTQATFEGEFMKKLSNTEAEGKKKRCL